MATRTERDVAVDQISYRLIDTLCDWLTREKRNLDGFIAFPEGHVEYNPYLDMDFNALRIRSGQLDQVVQMLNSISEFKKGNVNFTRAMHDYGFDHIPPVIWDRLHDWVERRSIEMEVFLSEARVNPPLPIPEYKGLVSFNAVKYETELQMYRDGLAGLNVVIQYLTPTI